MKTKNELKKKKFGRGFNGFAVVHPESQSFYDWRLEICGAGYTPLGNNGAITLERRLSRMSKKWRIELIDRFNGFHGQCDRHETVKGIGEVFLAITTEDLVQNGPVIALHVKPNGVSLIALDHPTENTVGLIELHE